MISLLRLLELAGQIKLMEALTPSQARAIFLSHGAVEADFDTTDSIKKARNKLIKAAHSDKNGGNDDATKEINAAYDILKSSPAPERYDSPTSNYARQDGGVPPWQTDSRASFNNISRPDYRDRNYFMMKMWELSGKSHKKYYIQAYDGSFFRSSITVFGSPEIFHDMAEAMVVWNSQGGDPYKTRAVFVSEEGSRTLLLIYLDGKFYDKHPIPFEHDSFNLNPSNDQNFGRKLPGMLDKISAENS